MPKTISVIGNINADIVARPVTTWPLPGNEAFVDSIVFRAGGGAGVTGTVLSALGAPCAIYGSVGDDAIGRALEEALRGAGADLTHVTTANGLPTTISIAVESADRDRSFLTSRGHLEEFSPQSINPTAYRADLVLFTGYFVTPLMQLPTRDLMRRVHGNHGMTFFDPGSDQAGWAPQTIADLKAILRQVDCFLPNAQEVTALTGITEPRAAAVKLCAEFGGWTVVKLGREGCLGVGPQGEMFSHSIEPVAGVTDTTGAGDSFNAGLLYAISTGQTLTDAAGFACHLASEVLRRPSDKRYVHKHELADIFSAKPVAGI